MTIRFGTLRHTADLARALGTMPEDLEALTAADPAQHYTQIRIPKRGRKRAGQYRICYKVHQSLAIVQKNIADAIAQATDFDECVQGFVLKRSIGSNARAHLGRKQLLHADIHHFFESVTIEQVRAAFVSLGCNAAVAEMLTKICTREGHLPEGSSSSPVIAESRRAVAGRGHEDAGERVGLPLHPLRRRPDVLGRRAARPEAGRGAADEERLHAPRRAVLDPAPRPQPVRHRHLDCRSGAAAAPPPAQAATPAGAALRRSPSASTTTASARSGPASRAGRSSGWAAG